jgi:hypothetical protein
MNDRTEKAIHLLTRLARGDVALVRSALLKHERDGVDKVIGYIEDVLNRREAETTAAGVDPANYASPAGNHRPRSVEHSVALQPVDDRAG